MTTLIEDVDTQLDSGAFTTLHGWCTPFKAKKMARLVARRGPNPMTIELGVFGGRGVIAMGLAVKHCLAGRGIVHGIDPFTAAAALEGTSEKANQDWWGSLNYADILKSARDGITRFGLDGIASLKLARSQDALGDYADQSIDVLHMDSNHAEEIANWEVANWTAKMKPGGFWVFDDTNWPSTKLAQTHLAERHRFTLLEQHDTWAVYQAP